jgi:hypothetical protein
MKGAHLKMEPGGDIEGSSESSDKKSYLEELANILD